MALACNNLQSGSSTRMRWKYDVFLSFRGEDTRNNFTDHVFGALNKKNIITFRDDTKLKKGEHISSELQQAIVGSRILIVIFSTNYASSTWCLEELAKIADCINVPGQSVLPIFYDVSPSEVRKQSGYYEKAFQEHEQRFKANLEEVQRWRGALTQVANLSGWDVRDKPQYGEIGKIIKEVACLLGNKYSNLPDIVGMNSRVEELENLLILDSDDNDVRVVGICGMGGIGKTTLATTLYAKFSNQFDAHCFIDDVSKIYGDHGPIGVQKELLCQTSKEENLQICNLPMASNLIRNRLCQIKSLVVLDNVDEGEQLDKLDMKREWLGTGSRIIIISRNEHILREYGVDKVYKVRLLDRKCALQLFCRKAFKSDDIKSGYIYLTNEVLAYANGLPLAIKVLGSFLYGRDVSEWSSALARLRENPRTDIMNVFRISFDGLEDTEKEIFLDIACFFNRESEVYLKEILDFRGFHPEIGLKVLIDKSFITREKQGICMHNLLVELGKSVVREISPKEPRKWNRIWDYKDVHSVISENMAAENLEAIVLQRYTENDKEIQEMTTLRAEGLAKMSHLKLLMLWNLNFSGSLNFLSSDLGYLYWEKYPFTSLPSSFHPDKLVELVLQHSNVKKLWEGTKTLPNLTRIDLSDSKNLIMMPNFKEIPNLESLNLKGCIKLVKIDPSIGTLRRLSSLNLKNCTTLVSIPDNIFGLRSIKFLSISGCPNLFKFDNKLLEIQRQTKQLEMLDSKDSIIQYQPTSFIYKFLETHFRYLIFRKPEDSVGLLLPSLSRLSCLEYLDLSFCNLLQIPTAIGLLHCLETLYLGGNNFVTLPSSIKELSQLRILNLQHCKQLKYLPELPSKNVLQVRRTMYAEFNIFDCPSLIDMECCYRMAFSWMIQFLQVHMQSKIPKEQIRIVIPKTEIPMWLDKQNAGSSISIDPSPIMHDKNRIGVACCLTFVAHDNPTNLGEKWPLGFGLGFQSKQHGRGNYSIIPIRLEKDLVTVDLDHLLLIFFSRESFIGMISYITEELHDDISGIELTALMEQPLGLHLEVKNCGYRWIFKEDLEQLNPEMMYSGNSSVQPYYFADNKKP
ncbi:disease resistance protein RUN1-like [Vicia villosa]|uniref:disease resistance protein RUN1-like n=1 Tax=Vicia villosa TaxID=3911 RepID=UPI00273CDDF3|nr:disease resistance protein RUN1-like [Vicia villosa]XP_058730476.1 disease resistance protein RUN1-like [Vicia villosa]XP_058730478.1 disease resistance protein RUN1-like [Vicia villosa]XP_058730479.1 disease resistance protein RUN1-like [Vicia villosa]